MTKQETIEFLKNDQQKLKEVVDSLSPRQVTEVPVVEKWTVKDILAHISAWHWEWVKDIDGILANRIPWYDGVDEAEFNQKEIEKRASWSLDRILKEWEDSFAAVIGRMEELSPEEWNHKTGLSWLSGTPLMMPSLFDYEYEGAGHEGGHAKQIRKVFEENVRDVV